jgi:hypothetical protein
MKPETPQERHLRAVAELTADYTRQGYTVISQPRMEDTPEFLRPYLPDLLATKDDERWIIDVKTPGFTVGEQDGWSRLSRHAAGAGWRFRLVVARSGEDDPRSYTMPDAAEIEAGLADPPKLAAAGQQGAALLLAWSLFEAAARRRLLDDDEDPGRPATPLGLVKTLVSLGHVDEPEFDALRDITALRNQVAHGLFQAKVSSERLALLATLTRRLLTAGGDARSTNAA